MNPIRTSFLRVGQMAMRAKAPQRMGAAFTCGRAAKPQITPVCRQKIGAPLATALFGGFVLAGALSFNDSSTKKIEVPARKIGASDISNWENKRNKNRPLVIVAGVNGVGRDLIVQAEEKGYDVLAFSRRPDADPRENLCIASTPRGKNLHDTEKWIELLEPVFQQEKGEIVHYVNMIGDTVGNLSECAYAMASALDQLAEKYSKKIKFVQLSSIAASYLKDQPYAKHRNEIDQALTTEYPHLTTTVFRPSLIIENGLEDHSQAYGPWQLASMPIPLAISSELKMQPLTTSDLNDAILNARNFQDSKIVNAVGPDPLTQKEIVQIFVQKQGRNQAVIEIPIGKVAQWIGVHAPCGRFHDYAIKLALEYKDNGEAAILSTEDFREHVGHELTSIKTLENHEANRESPPIAKHIGKILKTLTEDPAKRKNFFKAMAADAPLLVNTFKEQTVAYCKFQGKK